MRAAIYARYSSNNQREESIDAQIRAIKDYCDSNGYSIVKKLTLMKLDLQLQIIDQILKI